jgi:putative spermidine/putrescine transport system substrate-binding protein
MTDRIARAFALTAVLAAVSCRPGPPAETGPALRPADLDRIAWDEIVRRARGSTVAFGMWAGDERRNRYLRERTAAALERRAGVALRIVPAGDIAEIVNKLLSEKAAGKDRGGSIDLIWINGENFRAAKRGGVLWGPFASGVPNIRHYDDDARRRDFGEPVEDYEAPWQRAQFVMAYDAARVPDPPRSIPALKEWIRTHPGRFTYLAPPDFTGSAFLRHLLFRFGGGPAAFETGFDEELYRRASEAVFAWLEELRPYLWRRGETYPQALRELDRLFANSEVDFAMSYNPSSASRAIELGEFPPTTRTFVFEEGSIGNYNCLAIPFNASNPAGALAVIDYLLSPESALAMSRDLGLPFPLRGDHLSAAERAAAAGLPRGAATLSGEVLESARLPEADSRYLARLERDWREKVLRR